MMKKSFIAVFLFVPMLARAGLIEYEFSGTSEVPVTGWSISGSVILDDADAIAGVNLVDSFVSWVFTWTDGVDAFSTSSATDVFLPAARRFIIDGAGSVSSASLCTGTCTVSDPVVSNVGLTRWTASVPGLVLVNGPGSWSGAKPVAVVPSPGTLALLCIGILGLGHARRNNP